MTRWWHVTCVRCNMSWIDCLQADSACCRSCDHDQTQERTTMNRETADQAWEMITERAMTMMRTAEMQNGIAPAKGGFLAALEAGISFGIAAAAEHYREHPEHVPDPADPV